jgi:hypothetical protein
MIKIIDPANGWRYGFPKPIPEDVKDVKKWLAENGYPEEEIESFGESFIYRCWYEGDDD